MKTLYLVAMVGFFVTSGGWAVTAVSADTLQDQLGVTVKKKIERKLPTSTCPIRDDCDGDGHRNLANGGDDCDDTDPHRYPGNVEVTDEANHDEDCDANTYGSRDLDRDGYVSSASCNRRGDGSLNCGLDCDDGNDAVTPGAQTCKGLRNVQVCRKKVPSGSDQSTGGTWQDYGCKSGCVTQANGLGICLQ